MSTFAEHNPHVENRIQYAFKGKREHVVTLNTPNIAYPGQTLKIEIPKGSSDTVIVRNTLHLTFNLELESKDKNCGVVQNVGREIITKKVLNLGSKEIESINNSNIFDTYKDLYLSKKDREDRILQGIQSSNGLKGRLGSTKSDGTALTLTATETAVKKTLNKRFSVPLDFDFFNYPVCPYALKEDIYITIQLNSPEKVLLASGDVNAKYKISDITLEYDVIIDETYAQIIADSYTNTSLPYTRISNVSYISKSKKDSTWVIDINATAQSLQGVLLLFKDASTNYASKNEEFYNPSFKNILVSIDGNPHQIFKGGLTSKDIYTELKRYFYHPHSDVNFGEFLTTKFGLWIDTRSSQENALHGSGKTVLGTIKLQIDKIPETTDGTLTCYIFKIQDVVAHILNGTLYSIEGL